MSIKRLKNRLKPKNVKYCTESIIESDEYVGFIVGYTSNGAPYGLTHKEMDEINGEIQTEIIEYNLDLPF